MADLYSPQADHDLDKLEGGDPALYDAVMVACEMVFRAPERAQAFSGAIVTAEGIIFRLPVAGMPPWKVFWSAKGPTVLAVLKHGS